MMSSSVLSKRKPMDIKLKLGSVIFLSVFVSLSLMFVVHTRHKPSLSISGEPRDSGKVEKDIDNLKEANVDYVVKFKEELQEDIDWRENGSQNPENKIKIGQEHAEQRNVINNNDKDNTLDKEAEVEINGGSKEEKDEGEIVEEDLDHGHDIDDEDDKIEDENEDKEPADDAQIQEDLADDNVDGANVDEMEIDENVARGNDDELQKDEDGDEGPVEGDKDDGDEGPDEEDKDDGGEGNKDDGDEGQDKRDKDDGEFLDYRLYDDHPADKYLKHGNVALEDEPEDDGDMDNHLADNYIERLNARQEEDRGGCGDIGEGEAEDAEDPDDNGHELVDDDDGEEDERDLGEGNGNDDENEVEEANVGKLDNDSFIRGMHKVENIFEKDAGGVEDEFEDGGDVGLDNDDDNEIMDNEDDGEHGDENAGDENDVENNANDDAVLGDKIIHDET